MFATPPLPPPAIPALVIQEEVRYYAIEGRNEPELVAQMNTKGYASGSDRYWAYTSPQLTWNFDVKVVGGSCVLVDPKVSLTITTTLPSWTPPPGTSATVVAKWHELGRAMRHHEGEHAEIARTMAGALVALMREHHADVSCDHLNAFLQAKGRVIMQRADAAGIRLDAQTRHGASEGVALRW